jgi:hypothetical protein
MIPAFPYSEIRGSGVFPLWHFAGSQVNGNDVFAPPTITYVSTAASVCKGCIAKAVLTQTQTGLRHLAFLAVKGQRSPVTPALKSLTIRDKKHRNSVYSSPWRSFIRTVSPLVPQISGRFHHSQNRLDGDHDLPCSVSPLLLDCLHQCYPYSGGNRRTFRSEQILLCLW